MYVQSVKKQGQSISYAGVNAHFQNGMAEKWIRDLQEAARAMLMEAKHLWPVAIDTSLWPYALNYANYIYNHMVRTKDSSDGFTPFENFTGEDKEHNLQEHHAFGCPAYVLQD